MNCQVFDISTNALTSKPDRSTEAGQCFNIC